QAIQNVLNSGIRTADIMQDGMARVSSTVMMDSILKELNKLIGV
ncbi:MAG: 3-isopropylmalate dehydrogenase, partial [Pseudomonadota bacterium]|nr:3-isopropylmalate dehydrogenase [Pseudomonadota bacterium]